MKLQRETELRDAARILGVGTIRLLDHVDSGMDGEAARGTLAPSDRAAIATEVRSVIDELRPDVVVTLDASDGHRDHAVIRDATLAAVDTSRHQPAATHLWCLTRSSMTRWAEHLREVGGGGGYVEHELGTPDEEITTLVDVSAVLRMRWEAIGAHASQASPYDGLPAELQHEFLATDRFVLARGNDVLA